MRSGCYRVFGRTCCSFGQGKRACGAYRSHCSSLGAATTGAKRREEHFDPLSPRNIGPCIRSPLSADHGDTEELRVSLSKGRRIDGLPRFAWGTTEVDAPMSAKNSPVSSRPTFCERLTSGVTPAASGAEPSPGPHGQGLVPLLRPSRLSTGTRRQRGCIASAWGSAAMPGCCSRVASSRATSDECLRTGALESER